jgi:hypothetical protein
VVQVHQILLQVHLYHTLAVVVEVAIFNQAELQVLVEQVEQVEVFHQLLDQLELPIEVVAVVVVHLHLSQVVLEDQESLFLDFLEINLLQ